MNIGKISFYNNYGMNYKRNTDNRTVFGSRKEKLVTDGIKLGASALSASALFLMAKNDVKNPEKIIDEYYANENSRVINAKFNLNRFSEQEKYEINHRIDDINLYPKAFRAIINAKNEDNTYKFDFQDSMTLFDDAGEEIDKYPEIFKQIINAKDKDGETRFNRDECAALMGQADLLKAYPKAFEAVLSITELDAEDCRNFITDTGAAIQEFPFILDEALQSVPKDSDSYGKQLIHTLKRLYLERTDKQQRELKKQREIAEIAARSAQEEKAQTKANARAKKAEAKQAVMEEWNKKTGWIDAKSFFEKVDNSVSECKPLILESGEIMPDKMKYKIDYYILLKSKKAKAVINARYENLQPMFSEKECCEIINELDLYKEPSELKYLKTVRDGKPFFNSKQCKELLQIEPFTRKFIMEKFMNPPRECSADEIVEIAKNTLLTGDFWLSFRDLVELKDENGNYKYTVQECIEKSKQEINQ